MKMRRTSAGCLGGTVWQHMSDSEDEEHGRIRFGHDGDYEDGQWIGGEFYARRQKQGRVMSKEEALYGYEGSSDEEGGRRGKKKRQEEESFRPIDFVKGKTGGVKRRRPGGKGDSDDDDDEEAERGLGFGSRRAKGLGFQGGGGSSDENEDDDEEGGGGKKAGDDMDVDDEDEGGGGRGGLGLGAGRRVKQEVDVTEESKAKFQELLKQGGVGSSDGGPVTARPPDGKSQDFFRGVIKDAEDKVAAEEAKLKRKQALPVRKDKDAFAFENHTKGFASKFLAKFGFKGRLGKDEQGIMKVPEVVVRSGKGGLGTQKEATQLRTNREIEADLHGKELEPTSDDEKKGGRRKREKETSKAEKLAGQGGWKKGAAGKKKRVVLSVEDVLRMEKDHDFVHEGEKKQVIVDMRGPQPKLLTRTDEINYDAEDEEVTEEEPPKLGQELLHNVHLLVDLCESELFGLDKRLKHDQSRVEELEKQLHDLDVRVQEGESKVDRLSRVSALISRVDEKIKEKQGDVPMDAIIKVFGQLRESFWEEYCMFELWHMAPAMVEPVMGRFLQDWDPIARPEQVTDMLLKWRPVLAGGGGGEEERNPLLVKAGEAVLHSMVQRMVLPKIRSALMNRWEVRDVEPCVRLMEGLRPCARPEDLEGLLTTIVMPKINKAVSSWNPREDTVPIHAWLHPWLPLLGSHLSAVFPEIRRKLAQVLVEWHPSDGSALVILSPWVGVFDAKSMEQLLLRSIMPKLVQALHDLVIDPNNQDLRPLQWVLQWRRLFSPFHFNSLLEGEFFPKWMHVLYTWLAARGADFAQVADWFVGWKEQFPPDVVEEDPRIAAQFNHALQAMNDTMTHGQPLQPPLALPGQQSYYSVVEQRRMEVASAARRAPPPPPPTTAPAAASLNISFKDMVQLFAERNGVVLMPKPGRLQNGRQVWSFGGVSVYLDQDVVFADMGPGKGWQPIDLEGLLAEAQRRHGA